MFRSSAHRLRAWLDGAGETPARSRAPIAPVVFDWFGSAEAEPFTSPVKPARRTPVARAIPVTRLFDQESAAGIPPLRIPAKLEALVAAELVMRAVDAPSAHVKAKTGAAVEASSPAAATPSSLAVATAAAAEVESPAVSDGADSAEESPAALRTEAAEHRLHPHRRPLRWEHLRRPGAVPARPGHCISPVRPAPGPDHRRPTEA